MTRRDTSKFSLQHVYQLFHNYFSATATDKEREIVETWNAPKERKSKLSKYIIEEDRVFVYNKLAESFEFNRSSHLVHGSFSLRTIHRQIAVAASILLVVGLGIYAISESNLPFFAHEVAQARTLFQTTNDQIRLVILPDGSRIQMNRGTKFSYVTHAFNLKQREVWLEGEAFFEVAKNKEKPFVIHTGTMQTTVRGTSFNIKAYPQLAENVVSVRSGKVEVANTNRKIIATLTKNKQLIYHGATNHFQTNDMDWENAAGWMDGKLVLCNANVKELQFRIKQYFNADLTIEGSLLEGAMFNSSFNKGTGLKDILERICTLYNVHYELSGNKIRIHS